MTRKDFRLIADVFWAKSPLLTHDQQDLWDEILDNMCIALKATYPRFNEETFRKECTQ